MERSKIHLTCPKCRTRLGTFADGEVSWAEKCPSCGFRTNALHGVPVLRQSEENELIDLLEESRSLPRQNSARLEIPFLKEALDSNEFVLELGAGVDVCENPKLVKTDAYLYSTDLHCLADAHFLPFPDNSFGYVYSLAVFEHLHSPWIAAKEIWRVLKPKGKVFVLTAFMQHLHGYPSHYFNMTTSGIRQIFNDGFKIVRSEPSKWTSFREIACIIQDFQVLLNQTEVPKAKQLTKETLLENLSKSVENISLFDEDILNRKPSPDGKWARVAPAVELEAMKIG